MARVLVLYEDSAASPTEFGPHNLALACVLDRGAASRDDLWTLRGMASGQAMNGAQRVRSHCASARIFDRNQLVIAVYD